MGHDRHLFLRVAFAVFDVTTTGSLPARWLDVSQCIQLKLE